MDNNEKYIERRIRINDVPVAFCKTYDNVPHIIYNVEDKRNSVLYPGINTRYLHELFDGCKEKMLITMAEDIIEQKPAFPFVADFTSDDNSHYYALYAQEYVGFAIVTRRERSYFLRYVLNPYLLQERIEEKAQYLHEYVNGIIGEQENFEQYVWLKDKLVDAIIYPTLLVRGSFKCPYCGKIIEVLTTTYGEDNEYSRCHNCGLEYHIKPIECELEINQYALEHGFYEIQRQKEQDKKQREIEIGERNGRE